jgi:hypothetical protein
VANEHNLIVPPSFLAPVTQVLLINGNTTPKNPWVQEGPKIQTKGIENLFNEIIAENFLKFLVIIQTLM